MQRLAILYDASQAVLSTFDLDEVLSRILAIVRDVFHLNKGTVLLLDAKTQELYIKTQFGWDHPDTATIRVPLGSGLTGTAAKTKKPVYAPDVSQDPRYICSLASTRSELAIPLMVREEVVGVLDCQSDRLDFFDQNTLELLRLFSTQASIALANARLHSLEQRRRAQLEAINAIARQTTAMLEITGLLNQVCSLTRESFVSGILAQQLRKSDVLSRYGGEEFAIITPETGLESALAVCDKLRRVVESWHFPGVPRPLTISAGVAEYPLQGNTRDELVKAADEALYAAKQAGRNRVGSTQMLRRSF